MEEMSGKVLYVDDEQENLDGFYYSFFNDYEIFLARTPDQANDILEKESIEVMIVDQKMPQVSGVEFIKNTQAEYPDIIYIIITAFANLNDVLEAVNEANIYRFLSKPWNNNFIEKTLNEAVETYRLKQKNKLLIEELKEQNIELDNAYKKAQISDNLKSMFLKNLSHEIRTPLNGIMGFSQLLIDSIKSDGNVQYFANIVFESSEQLLEIFENIIDMSLIQSEAVITRHIDCYPRKVIDGILEKYEPRIRKRQKVSIRKKVEYKDDLLIVCDKEKMVKMLQAIIDNAIKFTSEGYINIESKLVSIENSSLIQFSVEDSGVGMDDSELDSIFQPFTQLTRNVIDLPSGNGIGLTICKAYVEMLNGTISVESNKGVGSKFVVNFPIDLNSTKNA